MEQIARFSPADVSGYEALLAHAEKLFQKGYVELGDQPFTSIFDMVKAAPHLVQLRADRSVNQLIAKHIKHPSLRQFFAMHSLLVGGDPRHTSSIYTLIHALERRSGVWFAKGGTGQLVAALAALMERVGVRILRGAACESIELERNQVRAIKVGGARIEVDVLVSNLDPPTLYQRLLPPNAHPYTPKYLAAKTTVSGSTCCISARVSNTRTSSITLCCSGRALTRCCKTSKRASLHPTQACICIVRRQPTAAWRLPAMTVFMCSRPSRIIVLV
ncbi:hypothetical protein HC761_02190 [bacterium]|nr:hypothetical protein [bacterium]